MATIPDAEAAGYIALKDNFALMMANPDAREMVLKAMKIAKPTVTNELDVAERIAKPLREELSETKKTIATMQQEWLAKKAADEEQMRTRQFEDQWAAQTASLRRAGYMDRAIEGIKKVAAERGIVSLEDAAAVYDKITPPVEVLTPRYGSLALMDDTAGDDQAEYMKKLFKGAGTAAGETRKQVVAALQEVRQQGRAA